MRTRMLIASLALAALTAFACSKPEGSGTSSATNREPAAAAPAAAPAGKVDLTQAQTVFNERCAACHGTEGKGNGPASAALNPKPRNYSDSAWQASVSDEQIAKTITMGGAAVGKSPMMPASPDLDEKPEVVAGLVKIVRKFAH